MRHARPTAAQREGAALHALGALSAREARAFTAHLDDGCQACRRELETFADVAAELALGVEPVAPWAEARARLLAASRDAAAGSSAPATLHFVGVGEGAWLEVHPGICRKELARGVAGASSSYLVRMAAGAEAHTHEHTMVEHCYIIAGDLHVAGRRIEAGDYHRADIGSLHARLRTEGGCLLLIVEAPA